MKWNEGIMMLIDYINQVGPQLKWPKEQIL